MPEKEPEVDPKGAGEPAAPTVADIAKVMETSAKSTADLFKQTLDEVRAQGARPVTPAVDPEAARKAQADREAAIMTQYQELCDAGKHAEGAAFLFRAQGEANRAAASQVDETQTPGFKALLASARRECKRDNTELFDKYGSEVATEVNAMPVGDRINPDMWDEAVRRVKARHVDEIVEAQVAARETAARNKAGARGINPHAEGAPGPGNSAGGDLSAEEDEARRMCGLSVADYTKFRDSHQAAVITKGPHRGMYKLVSDERPQPGAF